MVDEQQLRASFIDVSDAGPRGLRPGGVALCRCLVVERFFSPPFL